MVLKEEMTKAAPSTWQKGIKTIDWSKFKSASCLKQLTLWVDRRSQLQFAINQLDKHDGVWRLKQAATGQVAVFVPGEKDMDEPGV